MVVSVRGILGGSHGEDVAIEVGKLVTVVAKVAVGLLQRSWCSPRGSCPEMIIKWDEERYQAGSACHSNNARAAPTNILIGRSNGMLISTQWKV